MDSEVISGVRITPRQSLVWVYHIAGYNNIRIAKIMGISTSTVAKWIRDVEPLMKVSGTPLEVGLKRLYGMMPVALDSLEALLKKHNAQATLAYFRGVGLFKDERDLRFSGDLKGMDEEQLVDELENLTKQFNVGVYGEG